MTSNRNRKRGRGSQASSVPKHGPTDASMHTEPRPTDLSPVEPSPTRSSPLTPSPAEPDFAEPDLAEPDRAELDSAGNASAEPGLSPLVSIEPERGPELEPHAEPELEPELILADPGLSPQDPAEPGLAPQDPAELSLSVEDPTEAAPVEPDRMDPDSEEDGRSKQRSTTPSWSARSEPDVWSAPEDEDAQEDGAPAPVETHSDDVPIAPEDAWLQDAVHEPVHERDETPDSAEAIVELGEVPEPQASQVELPTGAALHDPESGDRWTVVDDSGNSAGSANASDASDASDASNASDSAELAESADGDEPVDGEMFGHDAGRDLDSSGLDEQNVPSPSQAAGETEASAEGAASNGREHDGPPAYPVPVTMSPKAKKFGWARESLLTGKPAEETGEPAEETGAASTVGKNARATTRPKVGKLGRGKKPSRVTASAPSATSPVAPGTTTFAAAGSVNAEPAAPSSAEPAPAAPASAILASATPGTSGAAEPGHGTARAPESSAPLADATGSGRADGPAHQVLQVLSPYLSTHRAALLTGSIALLLSVWLLIALPFPLKYAVDAAVASTGADLPALTGVTGNPERALVTSVLVLSALLILQVIARFTGIAALGRVGVRIATALRSRLLAHVHRLSPSADGAPTLSARNGGQADDATVRPLIDDVAALRDLLSHSGPRAAASALTLLSLLLVTVIVEPLAALVLLVVGALYALTATFALRRSRTAEHRALTESRMLADTADELIAATGTIQSYGLESRSERGLTEAGTRAGRALTRARRSETLVHLLTQLVAGVGVAGTLLLGGQRVAAGTMTPGDLVLVLADVLITIVVLRELLQHVGSVRAAPAAGDRIAALLAREAGIPEPQRTQPVDQVGGEIVFSAVNTAGGSGGDLFDAISLVVPAGQHVALLDGAGHESAALISYLLRFDQPDTGRVLLDRFDTRTLSLTDLRRQVAVVQREPVLFTDTVRENIRIGRPDATDAEVAQAARRAGIDDVIAQLSSGFDTVLVRRGNVLTDGQRRRIAIARALLRNAPIVVLDAADADLSTAERQPVLAALAALVQGRTAIVSSRDPETITAMDRVLWFESGEVREDAAPAVLAADPTSRLARWLRTQDESV